MVCAERTCGADWCWCCGAEIQGGANGVAEHYSTGPCQQFPDLTPTPGCWLSCIQLVTWPFKWCFLLLGLLLFIFCLLITPVSLTIILTFPCFFHVRLRSQQAFKSLILLPGLRRLRLDHVGQALLDRTRRDMGYHGVTHRKTTPSLSPLLLNTCEEMKPYFRSMFGEAVLSICFFACCGTWCRASSCWRSTSSSRPCFDAWWHRAQRLTPGSKCLAFVFAPLL